METKFNQQPALAKSRGKGGGGGGNNVDHRDLLLQVNCYIIIDP